MIVLSNSNKNIVLPTSYSELSWQTYFDVMQAGTNFPSVFGLDEVMYSNYVEIIEDALSFLNDSPPILDTDQSKNLHLKEFYRFVYASSYARYEKSFDKQIGYIACAFFGNEYNSNEEYLQNLKALNVGETYGDAINAYKFIADKEKMLHLHNIEFRYYPKSNRKSVDTSNLSKRYGYYLAIDELANGDITKHRQIELLSIDEVLTKLMLNTEKDYYKSMIYDS